MERCTHGRPSILCEACADAEVEKHKRFWHDKAKPEKLMGNKTIFRINGTTLEKAGGWVAADIAELEAEVAHAVKASEDAVAHCAAVQSVLAEARKALAAPEQPTSPSFS